MANIKYRNPIFVLIMSFLTLGIYYLYWTYQTKEEINSLGGNIPSYILYLIPIVSIYFHYEYAKSFVVNVQKLPENSGNIALYTILLFLFPIISGIIIQSDLNKYATYGK